MQTIEDRFIAGNYAIMRHAKDSVIGDQVVITESGKEDCVRVTKGLVARVRGKKVVVFHSPLDRARLTASIVEETLRSEGVRVESVESLDWLDDFSVPSHESIRQILSSDEQDFMLFVTHMPQVAILIGVDHQKFHIGNCALFSRDFRII